MIFITGRRKRLVTTTAARWQQHALFVFGGITAGAAAVVLPLLANAPA